MSILYQKSAVTLEPAIEFTIILKKIIFDWKVALFIYCLPSLLSESQSRDFVDILHEAD